MQASERTCWRGARPLEDRLLRYKWVSVSLRGSDASSCTTGTARLHDMTDSAYVLGTVLPNSGRSWGDRMGRAAARLRPRHFVVTDSGRTRHFHRGGGMDSVGWGESNTTRRPARGMGVYVLVVGHLDNASTRWGNSLRCGCRALARVVAIRRRDPARAMRNDAWRRLHRCVPRNRVLSEGCRAVIGE